MKYDGTYRGIIVQNNDPKKEGRVKVFVPGINLQQLKNWNTKKEEDKFFRVMGQNTGTSLTKNILDDQKERLFWAEVMLPIAGMSAPGIYNAPSDSYYIGNDSGYLFQANNTSSMLFQEDARVSESREGVGITFEMQFSLPRFDTNLNFKKLGKPFCINYGCPDGSPVKSNLPKKYKNILTDTFTETTVSSISTIVNPKNDFETRTDSILLDVVAPEIFIDDVPLENTSFLFKKLCGEEIPVIPSIILNPPILFEEGISTSKIRKNKTDVTIQINGRAPLENEFELVESTVEHVTYKSNNIKVKIPNKNIRSIKLRGGNDRFHISSLLPYLPWIKNIIQTALFPRSPMAYGQPMITRGGGGGEIYNNVTTPLLPEQMRRNSHIGGANNESRQTVNHGRTPINDPNNTKGANVQTNATQIYRGPQRSADYSNDWKGMISIPGVGAHVWVRFENGDVLYPIIVGTFAAKSDYDGIFESQ